MYKSKCYFGAPSHITDVTGRGAASYINFGNQNFRKMNDCQLLVSRQEKKKKKQYLVSCTPAQQGAMHSVIEEGMKKPKCSEIKRNEIFGRRSD